MTLPDNIERNPLGGYIGYDRQGFAFRITQTGGKLYKWRATPSHANAKNDSRRFISENLRQMSDNLFYFGNQLPVDKES
jgi:hypothetical protein